MVWLDQIIRECQITLEARHWGRNRVVRTSGDMTAVVWKDNHDMHMLTDIYDHQQKVNFVMRVETPWCQPLWKSTNNTWCTSIRVTGWPTVTVSHHTWKWTKKLFFHDLDLAVLNTYSLLKSCGSKLSHRDFWLTLVRNMAKLAGLHPQPLQPVVGHQLWRQELVARRAVTSISLLQLKKWNVCIVCHICIKKICQILVKC